MADNKYNIQIQVDKQGLNSVSQDMNKIMESFTKTSNAIKPLADSLNSAFSPKTLESITKITSGLTNLDRTIGGLTSRLERLGINLSNLSTSQAFSDIKEMASPGLVDQFGRPLAGQTSIPEAPASAGGGKGGGGGDGTAGFYRMMSSMPGGQAISQIAKSLGLTGSALRTMGIVGGIASIPMIAGNYAEQYRGMELSKLRYDRFGTQDAMRGNVGDMLLGNSPLTLGDRARIGGDVTGTLLKHIGIGAAGGAAVGSLGLGIGAAPGAIVGGIGGLISGGFAGARQYFDTRNTIQQENIVQNEEARNLINQISSYARSVEPSERISGRGQTDAVVRNGAFRYGQGAATDFANRMATGGINVDADLAGQSMGLERQFRAGAISDLFGRRSGRMGAREAGQTMGTLAGAGLTENGTDLVLRERAGEFISQQADNMGILKNIQGFGAYTGSFFSAARDQGLSPDSASRVGAQAFSARQNLYASNPGTEMMVSGLAGLGIKGFADTAEIQNLIKQGRVEDASALIKQKAPGASQADIDKVINRPIEMQKAVAGAMGFRNVEQMGRAFGTDELGEAFGVVQKAGRVSMGTGLSEESRNAERVRGAERTRSEIVEGQAARSSLTQTQEFAQRMEAAVIPTMQKAAEEFAKRLQEQLRNNPRLAPLATKDRGVGK